MKVNEQLVDKLAELAKLEFDKVAKKEIIHDLNNILSFVEQLNEVDTSGIEPLIYMNGENPVLRKDQSNNEISKEDGLLNATQKNSDYFKVPKVIQKK